MPTGGAGPGFKAVRAKIIRCLKSDCYEHEIRTAVDGKNLLAAGVVSPEEVIDLLSRCRGPEYRTDWHHFDSSLLVHIFKPRKGGARWYIKVYFVEVEPDGEITVFISVHESRDG